ncbi:MAG: acyl carrier protein [Alphaproteobacteria bacterium]|nr:acyl carrier protein [Alphaproteobacteria bacterium]
MTDIATEIRKILADHLGVEEVQVTDHARLGEDLGADSLDRIEIVMSCEERFGIAISNGAARTVKTVRDAIRCVEAALAAPPAEPRYALRLLQALR